MRSAVDSFSPTMLDQTVLAKPYFEQAGLLMAVDDSLPVGFVHAGFAPNRELSDLDHSIGIISQLKVVDVESRDTVASELLERACDYVRNKGAQQIYFGSQYPYSPFYLGLYGGAQLGGVLDEDEHVVRALQTAGFEAKEKIVTYSRTLAGFRTAVNRQQMSIRRQFKINAIADPLETSWWESCTFGLAERDCFHALPKNSNDIVGTAKFWDIQPLANKWGVASRGLHEFEIAPEHFGTGLDLFLLGESLRHLMQSRIGLVEILCRESDHALQACLNTLGFTAGVTSTQMVK